MSLNDIIPDLDDFIAARVGEATIQLLKDASDDLVFRITDDYYSFFKQLGNMLHAGRSLDDAPDKLQPYMTPGEGWIPLSDSWTKTKSMYDRHGFYNGITNAKALLRASGRKRNTRRKAAPTGTQFRSYLQTLGFRQVETILGDLVVEYVFQKKDRKITYTDLDNVIQDFFIESKKSNRKITSIRQMNVLVTVKGFTNLTPGKEWTIVDQIYRLSGTSNQWFKINSTSAINGHNRPIRALVNPMIRWYMKAVVEKALKQFKEDIA